MARTKWLDCETCGEGVECELEYGQDEHSPDEYEAPEICPHCGDQFTLGGGECDVREDFHSDG